MIRSLQLVTTSRPFFDQQVETLERNGVKCTVVSVPAPDDRKKRSVQDYLQFYGRVLRKCINADYDVVHANYGLTAPAAIAQPISPRILTLWGTDVYGSYSWVSDACASRFDAVIVMSEEMAQAIDQSCHVIPHGVDMERFAPRPSAQARSDVGWCPNSRHILFPYPPDRAVKNYPRAQRIVEAVNTRLEDSVELHAIHSVPHDRIPVYMNAADALLLTSNHEGSPNAVKEALACNLPVVATDVGDVQDYIADLPGAHICRSDEALVEGLIDVLSSNRTFEGRNHARTVSRGRTDARLLEVYEEVLDLPNDRLSRPESTYRDDPS